MPGFLTKLTVQRDSMTRFIVLTIFVALLAGCAATSPGEMPAAATATAAPATGSPAPAPGANSPAPAAAAAAQVEEAPPPKLERHEAAAQCWMKYDKSGGSLEAKAKLVDKCIDEKVRGGGATAAAAPKPKR
jgi:hypothetical protein